MECCRRCGPYSKNWVWSGWCWQELLPHSGYVSTMISPIIKGIIILLEDDKTRVLDRLSRVGCRVGCHLMGGILWWWVSPAIPVTDQRLKVWNTATHSSHLSRSGARVC